jgi:hypothetical protein
MDQRSLSVAADPSPNNKENEVNNHIGKFRNSSASRTLVRGLLMVLMAVAATGLATAQAQDEQLKFRGGIGVITVTGVAANGAANLNIVRGVTPGAPWRISSLEAEVSPTGRIKVVGHGLLLASGNGIGTNAGQSVHATLFCGAANAATAHDTTITGVPLAADGDFKIDDLLSPAPVLPCVSPVLLIRNVNGLWFAAGIPDLD